MSVQKSLGQIAYEMHCEAQGIDVQLPKYAWAGLEDTGKDTWEHVAGAVTRAASERQKVDINYIDVAAHSFYLSVNESTGGEFLHLETPVPKAQRHHKTPGATGAIVGRMNAEVAKAGKMFRISVIDESTVRSEAERIDRETGEVRELLDNEGTW